jgi:hypothetical protein
MAYILLRDNNREPVERWLDASRRYREYLQTIASRLPIAAREFALADWHYNHADHRCPHDSWLEDVNVWVAAMGDRREKRRAQIRSRFLGAYHDGYLELVYSDVSSFCVDQGLGDWLYDEVRLSDEGSIIHEIEFAGGYWNIVAKDIRATWIPATH